MSGLKESQHLQIPLGEIELVTNNIETAIGKGGFGLVYKGELFISGKSTIVAVKRLDDKFGQGLKEFLTEIHLLSDLKHRNLISLIGYCEEGNEKIIVYEYAARGSLDKYVRSTNTTYNLTWLKRLKICVGVAFGLDYLHNHVGDHHRIIHRDIKSANILIDQNWEAKISDLGLSKLSLANVNKSAVISHACGTAAYCDPEYISTGIVTKESDVYSFGVVLFEVLCGKLCFVDYHDGRWFSAELVKRYYENTKLDEIIDPDLRKQMSSRSMITFSAIAYRCLQVDRGQRPPMGVVLEELEQAWKFQVSSQVRSKIKTGDNCMDHEGGDEEKREHESGPQMSSTASAKVESQPWENTSHAGNNNETSGLGSPSFNFNSISSASSFWSTNSSAINKVGMNIDNLDLDYEILWDDLIIGEQIGRGSCGTVYHALWYGSDVAVKVFPKQEFSNEVILSFRQEVSLMKRLRHPNVLLFMGAVTSPQRQCIITEFLPRGSLFRLLQRNTTKLDWRRRIHMAMNIARGMNYLHHCHPPIIHRDLKSSNLLVDANWGVKVGDFGLSHIKHEAFLTMSGKGTPQWMAPEVLRNDQADEKSDVYSYGVVLWEITTEQIPWDDLNSMQVVTAVGFMNQRLDIPKDVDPQWASLIESCWCSELQSRPTFQEILDKLKDLQIKFSVRLRAFCNTK